MFTIHSLSLCFNIIIYNNKWNFEEEFSLPELLQSFASSFGMKRTDILPPCLLVFVFLSSPSNMPAVSSFSMPPSGPRPLHLLRPFELPRITLTPAVSCRLPAPNGIALRSGEVVEDDDRDEVRFRSFSGRGGGLFAHF